VEQTFFFGLEKKLRQAYKVEDNNVLSKRYDSKIIRLNFGAISQRRIIIFFKSTIVIGISVEYRKMFFVDSGVFYDNSSY
jgi:hypothetical protein